jgi:hypothetical protein
MDPTQKLISNLKVILNACRDDIPGLYRVFVAFHAAVNRLHCAVAVRTALYSSIVSTKSDLLKYHEENTAMRKQLGALLLIASSPHVLSLSRAFQ